MTHKNIRAMVATGVRMRSELLTVHSEKKGGLVTRMHAAMDEEIDSLIKRPQMHVGFPAEAGGLHAAEDQLGILLDYRYFGQDIEWKKHVQVLWPEGHERPGALGWRVSVLHRDDKTFDAWSRDVAKIVATIRERHV